jgi:hypothetical protein
MCFINHLLYEFYLQKRLTSIHRTARTQLYNYIIHTQSIENIMIRIVVIHNMLSMIQFGFRLMILNRNEILDIVFVHKMLEK